MSSDAFTDMELFLEYKFDQRVRVVEAVRAAEAKLAELSEVVKDVLTEQKDPREFDQDAAEVKEMISDFSLRLRAILERRLASETAGLAGRELGKEVYRLLEEGATEDEDEEPAYEEEGAGR